MVTAVAYVESGREHRGLLPLHRIKEVPSHLAGLALRLQVLRVEELDEQHLDRVAGRLSCLAVLRPRRVVQHYRLGPRVHRRKLEVKQGLTEGDEDAVERLDQACALHLEPADLAPDPIIVEQVVVVGLLVVFERAHEVCREDKDTALAHGVAEELLVPVLERKELEEEVEEPLADEPQRCEVDEVGVPQSRAV